MNGEKGRKGKQEKTEPVRMGKDFDFRVPVTYVMFRSAVQVEVGTTIVCKIAKSVYSTNINSMMSHCQDNAKVGV